MLEEVEGSPAVQFLCGILELMIEALTTSLFRLVLAVLSALRFH